MGRDYPDGIKELSMQKSDIFEKHYHDYCDQVASVDLDSVKDILGLESAGNQLRVKFANKTYNVSGAAITDSSGKRPDYMICVILFKYILLCPNTAHHDEAWVSFKDFKRTTHFTNVNYFASDTEMVLTKAFAGRLKALEKACKMMGGSQSRQDMPYDLCMELNILPRISALLLFNDKDEDFPAKTMVLFQKHAEFYLDPESMAMASAVLAKRLVAEGKQAV